MNNPLLEVHELPPFDLIKAEHVVPAITKLLAKNRTSIDALLTDSQTSALEKLKLLGELEDNLAQAYQPVSHLNSVVNSPELREAWNTCRPLLAEYSTELGQNKDLFELYYGIKNSDQYEDLDKAYKKAVDNAIRDFKLSGIDLPAEKQERYKIVSKRLSELSGKFNDNVLDATMGWTKLIEDANLLRGVPPSALELFEQSAEQRGDEGYLISLEFPSYLPVITYCENRELRREIYEAYVTRASEVGPQGGQWDNTSIMQEILSLKKEKAELLGYNNYAELSIATKMAQTTQQVIDFLEELAAKSRNAAESDFAEICRFALDEFSATEVEPWDVSFYAEKLKEKKFDVSEETLKSYFPAPTVISGMFEVVRRLYDIEIFETANVVTWHPDVKTYDVKKDGNVIARFYLDLFARQNKQGGAWMDDCRVRRIRLNGSLQLPVAYLTCNFSSPVGDKPSLLTHNEVVTLFHEFGHGLHHMMTRVDCADVSGINGVAWDAVELPSQFMENWCWEPEALSFLSGHFETKEPLPTALLSKMLASKNFQAGMQMARQLEFGLFDFLLHRDFNSEIENQIYTVLDEVRQKVAVVAAPAFNRFPNAFGHIFGGGYAAGYYSYRWAEVLSADAFSRFKEEGIFNRQTGEKFLSTILEQGGSEDPMDMFVAFMGREPSIDALLKQEGIVSEGIA